MYKMETSIKQVKQETLVCVIGNIDTTFIKCRTLFLMLKTTRTEMHISFFNKIVKYIYKLQTACGQGRLWLI